MTDPNVPDQSGAGVPPTPPPPPAQPAAPSYGQPAQPGYGQPGYGQPGYGSAYATAPAKKTNVLAIVSLVASIAGIVIFWFIGSVAGIICGHISMSQIKKTGEEGRGLAVAGLIVGYIGLALSIIGVIAVIAWTTWYMSTYGVVTNY
ncbi:DUF4190 domain-containing protein [Agromyces aerolatus]|uniref:DUF4190 domain-containing protein n=1 Tax=Agromyces sp. LY-1074 TaxID=3074080 RepID=UPI00285DA87B|nr:MULTISPECIES: DUF4190 domain-containing protein [unclassified Agromyces]MDR5698356.1 DUF4190 domain-containing protein [Agromyces sp. LY-1074]MDR5704650.1 DUF4190 domain-containing protein [Agromyces sp. LY-1358]